VIAQPAHDALLSVLVGASQQARDTQPQRLADTRAEADVARKDALAAEPWDDDDLWSAVPTYTLDGELGLQLDGMLGLPSIDAKELFGTRLAFDLLGRCDNVDQVADTLSDYFEMIREPEHAFLVASAALKVIAKYVERLLVRDS
jgi:hypothetical protein